MFPFLRFLSPKTKNNNWYLEPFSYGTYRMDSEASFSQAALPVFNGENCDLWAVKMEAYLEALDMWEAVEEEYEVLPLPKNPTMAQIKNHKEKKTRKAKAKSCLFAGVSTTIFTRIMTLKSAKKIWDYLKQNMLEMKEFEACRCLT